MPAPDDALPEAPSHRHPGVDAVAAMPSTGSAGFPTR
jgi:hypothetical protein